MKDFKIMPAQGPTFLSGKTLSSTEAMPRKGSNAIAEMRVFVTTYMLTFLTAVSILMTLRFAKTHFAELDFSAYAVLRRLVSFMTPLLTVGCCVAISRSIAVPSKSLQKTEATDAFFVVGALLILLITFLPFAILALFFPATTAWFLFGSVGSTDLLRVSVLAIFGSLLHTLAYAYLRGKLQQSKASFMNFLNIGLLPMMSVYVASNVSHAFLLSGLAAVFTSSSVLLPTVCVLLSQRMKLDIHLRSFLEYSRELLRWGLPRAPGDLILALLFYLPVMLTSHTFGILQAGAVAYSLSIVTLLQTLASPVSTIFLPRTAVLLSQGRIQALRRQTLAAFCFTSLSTCALVVLLIVFTEPLLRWHLGHFSESLLNSVRLSACIAIPFNVFVSLRSTVDAATRRALNTRHICFSLVVFCAVVLARPLFTSSELGFLVGLFFAMATLAILTMVRARACLSVGSGSRPWQQSVDVGEDERTVRSSRFAA